VALSAAEVVKKPSHEGSNLSNLLRRRDEFERRCTDRALAALEGRCQRFGEHRAFTQQSLQAHPRRRVEDREHIERITGAPRCAGLPLFHQRAAQGVQAFLDLVVGTPQIAQRQDEVLRHEPVTPFGARILTADVTYRDIVFPTGSVFLIGAVTGNRDGIDPVDFDISAERSNASRS